MSEHNAADKLETQFGFQSVEQGQKQSKVNDVFHSVAHRYDVMNDFMSGGLHRLWKNAMVAKLKPPRGHSVAFECLDVAGGTGDIAFRILRQGGAKTHVTVLDINSSMLEIGQKRASERGLLNQLDFVEANAEELPFSDACFNAYTIAFGIRNVPDVAKALREAYRVLKPGGQFLCLEFSQVNAPLLDKLYDAYSFAVIPKMGEWITGDVQSYRYLVESIRTFPNQENFSAMIREAGFGRVNYFNYTAGVVALHYGVKL